MENLTDRLLNELSVEYVDSMGNDLSVVNAARVSFSKFHDVFDEKKDTRLIRYLALHDHWTPFGHVQVSLRVKTPVFVARQLVRHTVGLVMNEVSRRYVDDPVEYYVPDEWNARADNKKQGRDESSIIDLKKTVSYRNVYDAEYEFALDQIVNNHFQDSDQLYMDLLDANVAPEQARIVLPINHMTEWLWTGSLMAWARVYNLRIDAHAQKETREFVVKLDKIMKDIAPISWHYLTNAKRIKELEIQIKTRAEMIETGEVQPYGKVANKSLELIDEYEKLYNFGE